MKDRKYVKTFQDKASELNTSDVRSSFNELGKEYIESQKKTTDISDELYKKVEEYYNEDKIKSFETFDEFLGDINNMLIYDTLAKLLFVNMVKKNYF